MRAISGHDVAAADVQADGFYSRWIGRWEASLANRDTNRKVRPFEWGIEWLDLDPAEDPGEAIASFSAASARRSADYFQHQARTDYRLDGRSLTFRSAVHSPHESNNTVHAEYIRAKNSRGRAVLVIPQWNSDEQSHLSLCRILARAGISALRLSPAYHHRRKPAEIERADYHVSSNVGRTIHATRQSVIDARCALDWLEQQGYTRLAMLGTSLGSCISLLTAAHDARLRAAVFNHVSMYFSDVVWTGVSCRHIRHTFEANLTPDLLRACWSVISPATYLDRPVLRSLESLLVWAPYDTTFRPEFSMQVLDEFRRRGLPHEVKRLPCGHYTSGRMPFSWMDAWVMVRFLLRVL